LRVGDAKLSSIFSSTEVKLPAAAGQTYFKLDAVCSSVRLRVPEGVAARIRREGAFSTMSVSSARFYHMGDLYQSPDYNDAANKVDIDVNVVLAPLTCGSKPPVRSILCYSYHLWRFAMKTIKKTFNRIYSDISTGENLESYVISAFALIFAFLACG